MRKLVVTRIRVVSVVVITVAVILIGRLYTVQIIRGNNFSERADRQYTRPQTGVFDRGSVFFEDKEGERIAAATIQSGFTLAINPTLLEESPEELFEKLSSITDIDRDTFLYRANKTDDPYEEIRGEITQTEADAINELGLDGVYLYRHSWRYYPGDTLAAQTVGFVGSNDVGDLSGQYGIERHYEEVLVRHEDSVYVNFFAEVFANISNSLDDESEFRGQGDLMLTIEPSAQAFLETTLVDVAREWRSREVGGIVLDPNTGAIVAMGTYPTFDLNTYNEVDDIGVFSNPLVEDIFEMGSIIKPLTVAAGIDSGAISADTTYNDKGEITYDGYTIYNYDGKARGIVPMQEVLSQSLNTGVSFVVEQMGTKRFAEYMDAFGLRDTTEIDLPGEVAGLTNNLDSPRRIEYATASFGQGIAMTPIATARALAALGNGGYLVTPHVVKEIDYDVGPNKKIEHEKQGPVISKETSDEITRMLVAVVDEALLGGTVSIDRHSIAAKTGTAQIAAPWGGYYEDRFLHSFFGYFPAYEPRFIVFLYNREPVGAKYASQTLTDPFMKLAKFLLSYYEVPPDR